VGAPSSTFTLDPRSFFFPNNGRAGLGAGPLLLRSRLVATQFNLRQ
jgi:hypothetical protein